MSINEPSRRVPRHTLQADAHRAVFTPQVDALHALLAQPPRNAPQLTLATQLATQIFELASVYERDAPVLALAARVFGQAHLGLLLLGTAPPGTDVTVPFGDGQGVARALGPNPKSDIVAWTKGWYGALIARDSACARSLRAIPGELLARAKRLDAFHDAWREALLALESEPERAAEWADRALALTGREHATLAGPGVPASTGAVFPMLVGIARRDAGAFNDALFHALQAHKSRWSKEPGAPDGWVAIAPTALACLAVDRGLPLEVDSEYLLTSLIELRRSAA